MKLCKFLWNEMVGHVWFKKKNVKFYGIKINERKMVGRFVSIILVNFLIKNKFFFIKCMIFFEYVLW